MPSTATTTADSSRDDETHDALCNFRDIVTLSRARVRIADANSALLSGRYEDMDAHLAVANTIIRLLELEAPS